MKRLFHFGKTFESKQYDGGIFMVDALYAGIEKYSCSYFVLEGDKGCIVEPCTFRGVPYVIETVEEFIPHVNVNYVIPTHVHLDHASSTSILTNVFHNSKVLCHPKTAKYLKDPVPLLEGSKQVYGEGEVNFLYGEVDSVSENRIVEMNDKEVVRISDNRDLSFMYTLGHSTHHLVVHDSLTNGVFTGDAFGMNYPEFGCDYIIPSASPIDFDPILMKEALDGIMTLFDPDFLYLTHFDVWEDAKYCQDLNHYTIDLIVDKLVKHVPDKMLNFSKTYGKDKHMAEKKLIEWGVEVMWEIFEETIGPPRNVMEKYRPISSDTLIAAMGSIIYVKRTLKRDGTLPNFQ